MQITSEGLPHVQDELTFPEHITSEASVRMDQGKINQAGKQLFLRNVGELPEFLGLVLHYRKLVPQILALADPPRSPPQTKSSSFGRGCIKPLFRGLANCCAQPPVSASKHSLFKKPGLDLLPPRRTLCMVAELYPATKDTIVPSKKGVYPRPTRSTMSTLSKGGAELSRVNIHPALMKA
ncbi:unnamed protein product [Calicophoron daubneyi]|uniref:Uncharacterized protein n=1 Tax=Calicophoron daubneyi TaxID=300641 RepID=A0AAV2TL64_CALDB